MPPTRTGRRADLHFLDTQVVSYAFSGKRAIHVRDRWISSVVANEFLNVYSADPTRANYYVTRYDPWLSANSGFNRLVREHHAKSYNRKRLADGIVIDFGNEFPTRVEYNRFTLAEAINSRSRSTIRRSMDLAQVPNARTILNRFDFLVDSNIRCRSIVESDILSAMSLLAAFTASHQLKDNFLNSFNDLLILATAARWRAPLHTEDGLLARFTASRFGLVPLALDGLMSIDFAGAEPNLRRRGLESKGFINRGWRVHALRVSSMRR